MAKVEFRTGVVNDGMQTRIEVSVDDQLAAWVEREPEELSSFIEGLIIARARMRDQVPTTIDPGSRLLSLDRPAWQTKQQGTADAPLAGLALRHPGVGWIAALFEPDEALRMATELRALSGPNLGEK